MMDSPASSPRHVPALGMLERAPPTVRQADRDHSFVDERPALIKIWDSFQCLDAVSLSLICLDWAPL